MAPPAADEYCALQLASGLDWASGLAFGSKHPEPASQLHAGKGNRRHVDPFGFVPLLRSVAGTLTAAPFARRIVVDDVANAYRKLSRRDHPDRGGRIDAVKPHSLRLSQANRPPPSGA